jgi:SpoVK/Ycf46/Vps4 family AAA+-type ATPase
MDGPKLEDLKQGILRHQIERDRQLARSLIKEKKYMEACSHFMSLSSIFRKTAYLYPPEDAEYLLALASNYETLTMGIRNKEMATKLQNLTNPQPVDLADCFFFPDRPEEKWKRIGGIEDAKLKMRELTKSHRAVLLYGPTGTGKRLLARTFASTRELDFYEVSVSNILSRYFGESRHIMDVLFDKAMRGKGAVIFIEDLDRFTKERSAFLDTKGTMLYLLAKVVEAEKFQDYEVFVMASAIEPWKMDPDITERFPARLHVMLPDAESRAAIFRIHLQGSDFSGVDLEEMVRRTEGFNGRDISDMCYKAMERMLLEQNPGIGELNVRTLQNELAQRPLKIEDFLVEPRPQPAAGQEYVLWKNEFGG